MGDLLMQQRELEEVQSHSLNKGLLPFSIRFELMSIISINYKILQCSHNMRLDAEERIIQYSTC